MIWTRNPNDFVVMRPSRGDELDYLSEDGQLTRIDAAREGLLTPLFFDGDVLQSVLTPEGPLSNGGFVRDRSGFLLEVGSSVIPEPGSLALLALGLAGLAIQSRKRRP
jgi:hypothetical protein